MPEALDRIRTVRSVLPPDVHVQVDGGIGPENIRAARDAGATCSSRARRSSAARTCRGRTGGWSKSSREPRAGARARGARARHDASESVVGAVLVRDGEIVGEGWHERKGGAACRGGRARGGRRAGARRDALRDDGAVRASRLDAAVHRGRARRRRREGRRGLARSESEAGGGLERLACRRASRSSSRTRGRRARRTRRGASGSRVGVRS